MASVAAQGDQDRAEEQYRFLVGLVEKGLFEMAVQEGRSFLRDHPRHARADLARYRLAGALWELDRKDEAAREYLPLARDEAFEYRAEALFRVGEAALARGELEPAREALETVLRLPQDYLHAPALLALGEAAFGARRLDQAEACYQRLLQEAPGSEQAAAARRGLAWCAWERGDARETLKRLEPLLERAGSTPSEDELRLLAGEAWLDQGEARRALECFRDVRSAEAADSRARGEGFALAALEQHAEAAAAFERLLESAPKSRHAVEARLHAGIERLRAEDPARALGWLQAAARENPEDPETLYWLAQAQHASGADGPAVAALEQALRLRPPAELASRLQALRGDCLGRLGRPEEALEAYERSGSERALLAAALSALERGELEPAVRLAEQLQRGAPRGAAGNEARVVLGEAYFAAGRHADAERQFAEVLRDPADATQAARALSRRAWCRTLQGDGAGGLELFAELLRRFPEAAEAEEALAMSARIPLERGELPEAAAGARSYLERFPHGRFVDQALYALARGSQGDEARQLYRRLFKEAPTSPLAPAAGLELAELESSAGNRAGAARLYAQVLERGADTPEGARASYGLAWCRWEEADDAGCLAALADLARNASVDPALRLSALELGLWARTRAGDTAGALEDWRELGRQGASDERRWEAARRLLASLRTQESPAGAQALLGECRRSLKDPALRSAIAAEDAYLALDQGDLERAEASLGRAPRGRADEPLIAEAAFHVGEARLARGDAPQALALFQRACRAPHPHAADAFYKLGFLELREGELDPARRALEALLAQYPDSPLAPEARFLLGESYYREQDFARAAEAFAAARPGASEELEARVLFRLGLSLGRLERWKESDAALSELATKHPAFPNLAEAELARARALAALDRGRQARAAFERTLALDQGELAAQARLGLGRLHEAEGRREDALSEYLKVALLYAHEPSVAEALLRSGLVLEALGDPARAQERYRELLEQHSRSDFVAEARQRLRALEGSRSPSAPGGS